MKTKRILIPALSNVHNYVDALENCGAEVQTTSTLINCEPFDALVLPGGGDIHPRFYGEEITLSNTPDEALDRLQMEILRRFTELRKPVLGICRGHQLINVFFEGSLYQHIDHAESHMRISNQDNAHDTIAYPDCFLTELYGESFRVNSAHHQAVKEPGKDLVICQKSTDGIVEAMYHNTLPIYSVQWHPERMCFDRKRKDTVDGRLLFEWFLSLL